MSTPQQIAQYNRNAILSASPARLLTMLYDRLILDLKRAEAAQDENNWTVATEQLLHAQSIIDELDMSLNTNAWDGANDLQALYRYLSQALISANINRDVARTQEAIRLLEPIRQAWHEAAATGTTPSNFTSTGDTLA